MAATVNQNPQSSPPPSLSTTTKVRRETIEKAVKALLKWNQIQSTSHQNPQSPSQQEDNFIYLILSLKKTPSGNTTPHIIHLPHPLFRQDLSSELCLIFADKPNSKNTKLTAEFVKKKVELEGIPVTKVIRMSKLKSDYKSLEAKRKLCESCDLILADKRVLHLVDNVLGKQIFKKKKVPLPVDLSGDNWKEEIERACATALVSFKKGACSSVRVGEVAMEREEIFDNVEAAIDGVVEFVPKKWKGVRSLHLKLSESLPLPLYQADSKLKIEGKID